MIQPRRGIIMAGGSGSRLHPLTLSTNKHLLPVYDRPMIDYPLTTLVEAGITEFLVITNPEHVDAFRRHLGTGRERGLHIHYQAQQRPSGVAEVFSLAASYISGDEFVLILGDNVFLPAGLPTELLHRPPGTATALAYPAADVTRFGCVRFGDNGQPVALEEKPATGGSGWAIPGIYAFGPEAVDLASHLQPSARGELEILDVLQRYLNRNLLTIHRVNLPNLAWRDVGTFDALLETANHAAQLSHARKGPQHELDSLPK